MTIEQLLRETKNRLARVYGGRLHGVVLCGSEARGDARPDSDIDILVLLDGPVDLWNDARTVAENLYDLMLEFGRTIDAIPVDVRSYEDADAPLYSDARARGIRV